MFCGRCGQQVGEGARFCSSCGAPVTALAGAPGMPPAAAAGDWMSRLQRPRTGRMIGGVCAGLARHYRWDVTWTRVLTVLIAVFSSGAGVVAYVVFWIVMPDEPWALPPVVATGGAPGSPQP